MIFEFESLKSFEPLLYVSSILPDRYTGYAIAATGALFIILFWLQFQQKRLKSLDVSILLGCSTILFGVYTFSHQWIDEVFVNLEHPYNLLHHGRFSYSPTRMVDGTVEFLYHLLLTPFALTQGTLIKGAFFIGFIVCWFHLFLIWKLLGKDHPTVKFLLLLSFCITLPLITLFACGFGNGLISLLLMACFYLQLNGKHEKALLLATAFPLIRPDAILYSFAVLFVEFLRTRRIKIRYLLGSIGALILYLCLVRLFYGHWIPTPISFKSFKLSMLPIVDWQLFEGTVVGWLTNNFHLVSVIVLLISFLLPLSQRLSTFRLYVLPLLIIFLFYNFTTSAQGNFGAFNGRYAIGFDLWMALFPILLIWEFIQNQQATEENPPLFRLDGLDQLMMKKTKGIYTSALIIGIYLYLLSGLFSSIFPIPWLTTRVDSLGAAGQLADRVVPPNWTISTTELNTFGFMTPNREVIDLWGYTNPEIAHSKICNNVKVRNNPDFFLQAKPDVFWFFLIDKPGEDYEFALQTGNMGKMFNQLGNISEVLQQYSVFFLGHEGYGITLLIKQTLQEEFLRTLEQKGFKLTSSRPLDMQRFERMYDSQRLLQYPCG
jgi:hypothetical protein